MDIMIPFMGRITRLEVQHKEAFHVAGVKDDKVAKVRNERKRLGAQRGQETFVDERNGSTEQGKDGSPRLDVWA
ncbi:hypothetical protein WCN91_10275 [Pseudoalteromonas sp. YIC-827]|uniref:Uncharacterized protein n=1 Tax=Pseudoalteromonas qingdaonensis TaxID=3131913 RepID=A0ABU9MWZ0_9GAMM